MIFGKNLNDSFEILKMQTFVWSGEKKIQLSFYSIGSVAGLKLQESLKIGIALLDNDNQEAKPCADESCLGM